MPMPAFRKAIAIICLALSLGVLAAPATSFANDVARPVSITPPTGIAWLETNLVKGADYYWQTVAGWFRALWDLAFPMKTGTTACQKVSDCQNGYACLNVCADDGCDLYAKRCVKKNATISIQPIFAACGPDDLCAEGTLCTRTCPPGASCATQYRCLAPEIPSGSCKTDTDCVKTCGTRALPPVGAGLRASCRTLDGLCTCLMEEIQPDLPVTACPPSLPTTIVCPYGTKPACTTGGCAGGNCTLRLTCLTAPEFGGQCLDDASCRDAQCPAGAAPFCDTDLHCRCRSELQTTVACTSVADCGSITCNDGETKACVSGACACAQSQNAVPGCGSAADCAACAAGYQAACMNGQCSCQRTVEKPVTCSTVADCGAVSCPAGFDKQCLNSQCACAKTTTQ